MGGAIALRARGWVPARREHPSPWSRPLPGSCRSKPRRGLGCGESHARGAGAALPRSGNRSWQRRRRGVSARIPRPRTSGRSAERRVGWPEPGAGRWGFGASQAGPTPPRAVCGREPRHGQSVARRVLLRPGAELRGVAAQGPREHSAELSPAGRGTRGVGAGEGAGRAWFQMQTYLPGGADGLLSALQAPGPVPGFPGSCRLALAESFPEAPENQAPAGRRRPDVGTWSPHTGRAPALDPGLARLPGPLGVWLDVSDPLLTFA